MISYFDAIYDIAKKHFTKYECIERFNHSVKVMEKALELNNIHNLNLNEENIKVASILHDFNKCYSDEFNKQILIKDNMYDDDLALTPAIWHAFTGASFAKELLRVNSEVENAIRYHTTGRKNMTMLEKIIFLADYIEDTRKFEGVEKIRNIANIDLEKAIYEILKNQIEYVSKKGSLHPLTKEAYEEYKLKYEKGEKCE